MIVHSRPRLDGHRDATRALPAAWVEPAPFADEVDVDFPSVSALVARIRDAFAGQDEAPSPLTVEVALTAWQARHGLDLPLWVPLPGVCPTCGGRGELWQETCHRCHGSGECRLRHRVTISIPPRVASGARVRFRLLSSCSRPASVELRVLVRAHRRPTS